MGGIMEKKTGLGNPLNSKRFNSPLNSSIRCPMQAKTMPSPSSIKRRDYCDSTRWSEVSITGIGFLRPEVGIVSCIERM